MSTQTPALDLPATGPGSLAGLWPRIGALAVDWFACVLICMGLFGMKYPPAGAQSLWPLGVLLVENIVLVGTIGSTLGHRLFGMGVRREDGALPGLVLAAARSVLLVLVVPAVIWHADGRGFHDRLARTMLLRTR